MKILHSIEECLGWRKSIKGSVGFIPTMGALHLGHLSLVKISKKACNRTIVSIFINPTQFSDNEDLDLYPLTTEQDLMHLKKERVDAVFMPSETDLYDNQNSEYFYDTPLSKKLEGVTRPHFFKGVTMIVNKLFNIINPTHAIFGEKDAQQLIIIKKMIDENKMPIRLVSGKTIRDKNGLARSSRNSYLSKKDRELASKIYKNLLLIKSLLDSGEKNSKILKKKFTRSINSFPDFKLDYISIACTKTLNERDYVLDKTLVSAAVFFKGVRLIDNFTYLSST